MQDIQKKLCKIISNYEKKIANMAKASQIALTTDLWSASDLTGYMMVTAHFVNQKWQLTKHIIGF
jgi:hypothetical protein